MVAILYLEVSLLRKNSKQYHTRQNARKPRKTAKNKQRLTGAKNTAKPLIKTVIQQLRWRRNATNRQTRHRAPHGGNRTTTTHPHAKHRSSTHARHTAQTRPPSARQSPQERRAHLVTSTQQAPTQAHKRAQKQKRRPTPTKERAGRRSHAHANQISECA